MLHRLQEKNQATENGGRTIEDAMVIDPEATPLLAQMTDDVAGLVLRDNYLQGEALSVAEAQGGGSETVKLPNGYTAVVIFAGRHDTDSLFSTMKAAIEAP